MTNSVIFDLDGTVLDNETEWEEAFRHVAEKHQIPKPVLLMPNGWWHEPGLGLSANWRKMMTDVTKAEQLARETVRQYSQITAHNSTKVRPGTEDLIGKIKDRGWRTALATGNAWFIVERDLEELGMMMDFDVTTTGEEVMVLKPDPEIYILSAQKLETGPELCLVIEDAVAGIRAAKEAGCKAIGLVSDYAPAKVLMSAGADYAVKNMLDIANLIAKIE